MRLLAAIDASAAPAELRDLPAIRIMRSIGLQQFAVLEDHPRLRDAEDLPPATVQICPPTARIRATASSATRIGSGTRSTSPRSATPTCPTY
jgi:hypothetical protein